MENKEENKMHIWILKPILFMKKGEEAFLSSTNLSIVFRGDSLTSLKVLIYIEKNASIFSIETDIFYLHINKIGDGMDGKDFFIKFPEYINYQIIEESSIKKELYLSPIDVSYSIATAEIIKDRKPDYKSLDFESLMGYIWADIQSPDYLSKKKDSVAKMMEYIQSSFKKYIDPFDDEKLIETKEDWEDDLEEAKESTVNGERRKISIEIYNMIIEIISKEIENRENTKNNECLKEMSKKELKKELDKAISRSDFEYAARIRDVLKTIQSN